MPNTHECTQGPLLWSGTGKHPIIIKQTPTRRRGWNSISTVSARQEGQGRQRGKKKKKAFDQWGLQYGVWSASLALSVFITDWTTLGVNTVMKDASESKEHKTTYLVDQRQTHTWQAAAARHRERNTTRERQHNINTQPMWGLTVAQQNKNQGHVKIDSASHGVVNRNKKKNNSNKANQTIKQIKGGKYVLPWCTSETSHCDVTKLYTLWMMCYFSMCRPRKF